MKQLFNGRHAITSGSGTRSLHPFVVTDGQQITAGTGACPVTTAGTLRNLRVVCTTGVLPSTGTSTISLVVNGTVSALSGVLNNATASFTDTSDVAIVEGDTVEFRVVTNSLAGNHTIQTSLEFEATATNTTMYGYGGCGDVFSSSGTECGLLYHGGLGSWNAGEIGDRAATAGTITKHRVRQTAACGAGITRVLTMWKNGVAQDGSGGTPDTRITLAGAGSGAGITTGTATFSLSIAAGDALKVRQTFSGGTPPAARGLGSIEFVSTAGNKAHYGGSNTGGPSASVTNYQEPVGHNLAAWSTTEAAVVYVNGSTAFTFETFRVDLTVAPGAGKSWVVTLRKNGSPTALTVTISGTATSASVAAVVTIGDGDTYALEIVPSGTPTGSDVFTWVFLGAIAATTVAVPDVVGDTEADAIVAIEAAGLIVGSVTTAPSDSVPAGHVISQSPTAGTIVALGTTVDIVIAVAAGLVILINGVEWQFRAGSMSIKATLNGRDTLSGVIDILNDADPPTLNQEIVVTEDGVRIFGGSINELEYRAITSDPDASKDLMVSVSAEDFNALADRRTVTSLTAPEGSTLKAVLELLVPELAAYGVTLSTSQVDGPVLPSVNFTLQTITAILDELSKLTEFVWEIDYSKVLSMWQPGTVAAPFNITDGDQKVWGDIVIRPIASEYANRIIVRGPGNGPSENVFAWYTDGTTNNFPMYMFVLQHFGQVLVDTPLETVPGEGYESVGAPGSGALWEFHDGPRYTQYLSRAAGAPPAGNPWGTVPYPLQFRVIQEQPIVVTADDLVAQAADGIVEKLVDSPNGAAWWELQALADSLLVKHASRRYTVQFSTRETGLRVGQSITMGIARRNLSGPYFITDVDTQMVGATILKRTVTANETELFQGSWRDTYKLWAANSSGGGGGGSTTVGTTVPVGGTPVPHHVQHEPGGMDPMTVDSTASIGSLRTLGTGPNQAAPGDDARFSAIGGGAHHATHEPGGSDPLANAAWTNQVNLFTQTQVIEKTSPQIVLSDMAQAANARVFDIVDASQYLQFRSRDDALSTIYATPLTLNRGGDAFIERDLYEKGRPTPIGHWSDVPYSAVNFGSAVGSWTVTSEQVLTNRYTLIGRTLMWALTLSTSTLGSASDYLICVIPGSKIAAGTSSQPLRMHDGTWRVGSFDTIGTGQALIRRLDYTAIPAGSVTVQFVVMLEVTS